MNPDFCNSVTEAQQKLHADMRRDTDMRWSLLPVYDSEVKPSRCGWMLGIGIVGLAAFSVGMFWI